MGARRACRRARRRSRRRARAALLGLETTPLRWFHTCRVIQTSSTDQVATTVLITVNSIAGADSHEAATAASVATIAPISVTDAMSTARTAAFRTGSGIRGLPTGSWIHSP